MSLINNNGTTPMSPINNGVTYNMLPINNSPTYTSLINESTFTGTTYLLTCKYTGTTYMSPINNKSTNDICALLCILLLIYKSLIALLTNSRVLAEGFTKANSLGFLPTNSLGFAKSLLLFFLLLSNQVEGTSFQFISLTNLNLSTIKPTFMSDPNVNSPIRPMNRTP